MRKLSFTLLAASIVFVGLGCSMPRSPAPAYLYANVKDAMAVTDAALPDNCKEGTSMATTIFGIVTGDSSIDAARKNGGIKKIHYVDYHTWGILGIYGTTTTKVYGE